MLLLMSTTKSNLLSGYLKTTFYM